MNTVKLLWALACLAVLLLFLLDDNAWKDSELATLCYLRTMILTFPLGAVGGIGIGKAFSLINGDSGKVEFLVTWLLMVALGYWQWFRLFPGLYRRLGP